jgi:hypothetical protein
MLNRRAFGIGLAAAASLPVMARAQRDSAVASPVRIIIPRETTGATVAPTLASLSYETDNLVDPNFFAATNTGLVAMFKKLNPQGVLRLGGNTSDLARPAGFTGKLPVLHPLYREKHRVQPYYDVTPQALTALAGFLDATGWKVIFGLNMRADSPELVATFAKMARDRLGSRILALQIGNEANNYFKTYEAYKAAWDRLSAPIGRADIAGPDSGANTDWVQRFSRDVPDAVLLSRHYYREAAERGSLQDILRHDAEFDREIATCAQAGRRHKHGFWLTETNSYYRGGLDGVSNAFAAALWGLDYILSAAFNGTTGVCLQGGPRKSIESSLEGHGTGGKGRDVKDVIGRIDAVTANYSPIGGDLSTGFAARPIFYGALAAQQFANSRFHILERSDGDGELRVFAASGDDGMRIAIINASPNQARTLSLSGLVAGAKVESAPLTAPSLTSRDKLGFGVDDRTLTPNAPWSLRYRTLRAVNGKGTIDLSVPAGSAMLLRVGGK